MPTQGSNDEELVRMVRNYIQKNRTTLVKEWLGSTKEIESEIYENIPQEDLVRGSELYLEMMMDIIVEDDSKKVYELVENSVMATIHQRIAQGLNLEYLMRASGLHRDQLLNKLKDTNEYSALSKDSRLELSILLFRKFELVQGAIARLAHEAAISEIDNLRKFNENIITSLREGLVIEDNNGIITYANPTFLKMLGYSKDELIGQHWEISVPPDQLIRFKQEASKRSIGIDGKYDGILRSKDGRRIPVLISARTLHEKGRMTGVLSVVTDITEMHRIQSELNESKLELEHLNLELQKYSKELEEDNIRLREILDIQPAKEKVSDKESAHELEASYIHLVLSSDTDKAFRVFEDLVKHGHPGLCVTRTQPEIIRKRYSLERTPMIWLTGNRMEDIHCISPSNIVDLSSALIKFLERIQDGVVILEGIEYLVSQNNFRSILNLIQLLNDKIMLCSSRILLPLDPGVFDPKELHLLKKELRTYDTDKNIFKIHMAPK